MKRLLCMLLCVLLTCCFSAQAVFANTYLPNTMIDDIVYLPGVDTYELYTIGYTVCCSSQDDWNLQLEENIDDENSVSYVYSATVKAGSVISAQLNCMSDVNLGIAIVAYDENGIELDRIEKGNNGAEIVDAELTVPENAKSAAMLLLVNPVNNNLDDWTGFSLQLDMTVEGQEGSAALTSGNVEDTAIDENTAEDAAELLKDKDVVTWAMEDQAEEVDNLGDAIVELTRVAVKAMIILAAIVGGSVAAIVVLIKKKAAKKAIKAGIKAAGKAVQTSAAKAAAGNSASTSSTADAGVSGSSGLGGTGDSYVVTDPATGAQTLYIKDANGSWVSSDGSSVLDADKIADWKKTRAKDRTWQNKSNEGLQNPTKFEDIDKQEALENEKIKRETYEEKIAIKHGMDTSDMDAVYQKVSSDTAREEVRGQKLQEHADHVDTVLKVTENIKTVADYSVSALGAVTGPAGKTIKDIYTAGTTIGGDVAAAVVEGKDAAQAAAAAVTKSAIGVIQNRVEGLGAKAAANIVGGAASGGVDAYVGGEDVAQGIVTGAVSGTASTVVDTGAEMVGALKDDSAISDLAKNLVSSASDTAGDLIKNTTSDAIEKSFDKTFKDLNPK